MQYSEESIKNISLGAFALGVMAERNTMVSFNFIDEDAMIAVEAVLSVLGTVEDGLIKMAGY